MRFRKISVAELRELVLLRQKRRYSIFNQFVLWAHYIVMVSLVISVAAKYISPELFWLPAFLGLAFPLLFVLNLLFIIYWTAQFRSPLIPGLIVLIICIPTAFRFIQFSAQDGKSRSKTLKVTTYNSMLFDLYNWTKNRESRSGIITMLSDINPDILCIQEFYTSEQEGDFNNTDTLKKIMKLPYFHSEFTITLREYDHWGIATFSKYPIINQGKIVFNTNSNNICIYSDIVVNKDTIRVYNVHLQSISFSKNDNKFLEEIFSTGDARDEMSNSRNILRRLKRAFLRRTRQTDMIVMHMKTSPYHIILCGDFNDTAASYAYEQLSEDLEDTYLEKGFGLGLTYAGKWPKFRIDYILHDKSLRCSKYSRSDETFTDHFPITAHFDNINWSK